MGKMTRDEFIKSLEKLNPDVNYENVLKFVQRQTKHRTETNKEVLRASWVFDVVFHIYHGVGTKKPTKNLSQIIRNYVNTKHYKDNYKLFLGRDWTDLKAIKDGKDPVHVHVKNCNDLLNSKMGKYLRKTIEENGGFFHVEGTGPAYLRKLKTKHKLLKDKKVEDLSKEELKELIKTEIPDDPFSGPPKSLIPGADKFGLDPEEYGLDEEEEK